jgi:hypothetical protein
MALLTTQPAQADSVHLDSASPATGGTLSSLFAWRTEYGFGWLEGLVLSAFFAVAAITIPFHEDSIDEAQSWLISSYSTAYQIVRHRLHYEGAPPLWDLIQHLFHLLHGTYAGINWIGATFAAGGVYVMLRWSPFPMLVRLLLPFTFFLQYQYAVIARPYTLFPLLAFTLCALYADKAKIVWFGLAAGLLANVGFQGFVFDAAIIALYVHDLYRERRASRPHRVRWQDAVDLLSSYPKLKPAMLILGGLLALAVYTAVPAPDVNFAVGSGVSTGAMHDLHVKLIGESPAIQPDPVVPFSLPGEAEPAKPSFRASPAAWAAWQVNHRDIQANGWPAPQSLPSSLLEFAIGVLSQITWPIAVSNLLALLFAVVLLGWAYRRRALRALLPWASLILLGQIVWVADHHAGMLFVAMICGIWLAARLPGAIPVPAAFDRTFTGLLGLVLALQIGWSIVSIRAEIYKKYDPGLETARFLKSRISAHPGLRIAAFGYYYISVQPYFNDNPFFNIRHRYWLWSARDNPELQLRMSIATKPDIIVFGREEPSPTQMRNQWAPISRIPTPQVSANMPYDGVAIVARQSGYSETHRFCGERFSRTSYSYRTCDVIFERDPNRPFHDPTIPIDPTGQ